MKRKIKAIYLKDGKQIFYPSDDEFKTLWEQVAHVSVEETYTVDEFIDRFVLIEELYPKLIS